LCIWDSLVITTYIVAQLSNALSQLGRGENKETVRAILTTAFYALV
jgi:hypothetical protein